MYGNLGSLQLGLQDSFGTPMVDVGSIDAVSIVDESLNEMIEQINEANMHGRLGESPYQTGSRKVEGSINIEAEPEALGRLLRAACGRVTTDTGTGLVGDHLFEPNVADFDSFAALTPITAIINRDVSCSHVFQDLVCSKLEMSITQGQLLTANADFIGTFFSRIADVTPTFPTSVPFVWRVASASYAGAVLEDLLDFSITLDNQLEARYTLTNTNIPQRILRTGPFMVTGALTMLFIADSLYNDFLSQAENPFSLNFLSDVDSTQLRISMRSMRLENMSQNITGPGVLEVSASYRGIFDTTSNTPVSFELDNLVTSYN